MPFQSISLWSSLKACNKQFTLSENNYERWTFPHDLCLMLEVNREEMFNVRNCFLTLQRISRRKISLLVTSSSPLDAFSTKWRALWSFGPWICSNLPKRRQSLSIRWCSNHFQFLFLWLIDREVDRPGYAHLFGRRRIFFRWGHPTIDMAASLLWSRVGFHRNEWAL